MTRAEKAPGMLPTQRESSKEKAAKRKQQRESSKEKQIQSMQVCTPESLQKKRNIALFVPVNRYTTATLFIALSTPPTANQPNRAPVLLASNIPRLVFFPPTNLPQAHRP
jgi:hypothetical protein